MKEMINILMYINKIMQSRHIDNGSEISQKTNNEVKDVNNVCDNTICSIENSICFLCQDDIIGNKYYDFCNTCKSEKLHKKCFIPYFKNLITNNIFLIGAVCRRKIDEDYHLKILLEILTVYKWSNNEIFTEKNNIKKILTNKISLSNKDEIKNFHLYIDRAFFDVSINYSIDIINNQLYKDETKDIKIVVDNVEYFLFDKIITNAYIKEKVNKNRIKGLTTLIQDENIGLYKNFIDIYNISQLTLHIKTIKLIEKNKYIRKTLDFLTIYIYKENFFIILDNLINNIKFKILSISFNSLPSCFMEYKKEYYVYYIIIFSKLKYLSILNIHYHDLYELYYIVQKHKIKDVLILHVQIFELKNYNTKNLYLNRSDKISHQIFLINNEIFRNYMEFLNNINNFNIFLDIRYTKNTQYNSIYIINESDKIENLTIIIDINYYSNIRPQLKIYNKNIVRLTFVNFRDLNFDFFTVIIENVYIPNVNVIFLYNFHLNINEIHIFLNKLLDACIMCIDKCILKEKADKYNTTIRFLVIYNVSCD